MDSSVVRALQVYRYPFSTATSNPKIPDGKLTQSFGLKTQSIVKFGGGTTNIAADANGQFLMLLFPGFGTALYEAHPNAAGQIQATPYYTAVTGLGRGEWNNHIVTNNSTVGAYRVVSEALKLRCVSSDDHNDGYWSAIRIPVNARSKDFTPRVLADPANCDFRCHVRTLLLAGLIDETNWLTNPTYQTGKIKNLGQFEFRLQPQKDEHDMVNIPTTTEFTINQWDLGAEDLTDGIDLAPVYDYVVDDQFDMIAIKIQGKAETEVLAHYVQNVEFTPPTTNTAYNIFQTETVDAGKMLKKKQQEFKNDERLPGKYVGGPRNS